MNWINHPAWSFIGVGAGVLGIALAIVFHRRSTRKKALAYDYRHFLLLSPDVTSLHDFRLTFKDQPIDQLTASKFLLWNSGNEIIERNDIADVDPLRIDLGNGVAILDA